MDTLVLRLKPLTAFGSPLFGDTLFGQLCWAIRYRFGEARLVRLLEGYTAGRPFVVVSDALPEGYLPRPALPLVYFSAVANAERKEVKRRRWIPLTAVSQPLLDWLGEGRAEDELVAYRQAEPRRPAFILTRPQPHNSINRLTNTTGRGGFAPYHLVQHWYVPGARLACWIVYDPARIQATELMTLFEDIGAFGFGRDVTIGLGKFAVEQSSDQTWPRQDNANACLTLAPCAPQGLDWDARRCFYEVFTRFGRHGDLAAQSQNPFKTPLLLARAGALLSPRQMPPHHFVGQGLGGGGLLSKSIPETVHQGYAPVVPVHLPHLEEAA